MAVIFKMAAISGINAIISPRLLPYRSALDLDIFILTDQKLAYGFQVDFLANFRF